jgi:hypothetical protein
MIAGDGTGELRSSLAVRGKRCSLAAIGKPIGQSSEVTVDGQRCGSTGTCRTTWACCDPRSRQTASAAWLLPVTLVPVNALRSSLAADDEHCLLSHLTTVQRAQFRYSLAAGGQRGRGGQLDQRAVVAVAILASCEQPALHLPRLARPDTP